MLLEVVESSQAQDSSVAGGWASSAPTNGERDSHSRRPATGDWGWTYTDAHMEGGPYEPRPGDPGYPRDPAYAQPAAPPPPPEYYEPPRERRIGLAEIVGLLALIGAIVAIFLALDAREEGSDDKQVARQIRIETQREMERIRTSLGQKAGTAGAKARQAEDEAEQTRRAVAKLRSQVAELQSEVRVLGTQQNQTRDTVRNLSETVSNMRQEGG